MFVIASEAFVAAPPVRVWTLLTAFEGYPAWTRSVQLSGAPVRGQGIDHRVPLSLAGRAPRPMNLPAIVREAQPGRLLVWALGLPGVISIRFSFELTPERGGTRLRHAVAVGGLIGRFARGRFERMLGPPIRALVADAAKALSARPSPAGRGRRR